MDYEINLSDDKVPQEAREIVEDSLVQAQEKLPIKQKIVLDLDWSEYEFMIEKMGGASGIAKYPDIINIGLNTSSDCWKSSLQASVLHEYAHIWDYEQRGQQWEKHWEYILGEALTQHFTEQNAEYESPWRKKHSKEIIAEYWSQIRDTELDKDMEDVDFRGEESLFVNEGNGKYPNWLGYSLSYQIGEQLLINNNLEDFPEVEKEEIIEAGNELYTK